MYRTIPYTLLFLSVVLLQVFLFDNLSLSVFLCPLIYIAFVLLLPIETPPVTVLFMALFLGITMDWTMGGDGVNTIATLPVAMLRLSVLRTICGKDNIREGGIPSAQRLGQGSFLRYIVILVALHHFLFFAVESLAWTQLPYILLRLTVSGLVSVCFIALLAPLFTSKLTMRS